MGEIRGRAGIRRFLIEARAACLALAIVLVAGEGRAQDLDAGKTPQQLFSSNCSACHRSPQGLARGRSGGAVAGFLTQHYTSGKQSAAALGAYLASVGGEARAAGEPAPARSTPRQPAASQRQEEAAGKAKERAATRDDRNSARRAAAEERAARERRAALRRRGEPATVESDPDPVTISTLPTAVVHERADSRAQEERARLAPAAVADQAPASAPAVEGAAPATLAARTAPSEPVAHTGAAAASPAPPAPAVATPPEGVASAAADALAATASTPAAGDTPAAAEEKPAASEAAPMTAASQTFSAPLP